MQLSTFRFLYLARVDSHFEKAKALFDSLVTIPLGSDVSADLLRYFQIRKSWDLSRYTSLTEADLISAIRQKPDSLGNASNISIADGKSAECPSPISAWTLAVASVTSLCTSLLKCFAGLRFLSRNLRQRGEEGKDYTLHLRLHLFLHPVALAISLRRVGCRRQRKARVTVEKTPNRAGATPLFRLSAAQKVS